MCKILFFLFSVLFYSSCFSQSSIVKLIASGNASKNKVQNQYFAFAFSKAFNYFSLFFFLILFSSYFLIVVYFILPNTHTHKKINEKSNIFFKENFFKGYLV